MLGVFNGVRTPVAVVLYALFLRRLGMSLRKISKAIAPFVSRSHNAVWRWEKRLRGFKDTIQRRRGHEHDKIANRGDQDWVIQK